MHPKVDFQLTRTATIPGIETWRLLRLFIKRKNLIKYSIKVKRFSIVQCLRYLLAPQPLLQPLAANWPTMPSCTTTPSSHYCTCAPTYIRRKRIKRPLGWLRKEEGVLSYRAPYLSRVCQSPPARLSSFYASHAPILIVKRGPYAKCIRGDPIHDERLHKGVEK